MSLTEPYSELKHWNLIIFNKNELIFLGNKTQDQMYSG